MRNSTCVLVVLLWTGFAQAEPPAELARWLQPQTWERDVPGPIISLGQAGAFDDMHIFAPCVAVEDNKYTMWYSGSRGSAGERVFRLGLATSADGKQFQKVGTDPVLKFADDQHSVLTPALLRNGDGTVLRENGKLRMWFSSARLGKSGLHTLHQSTSTDGVSWAEPSAKLLDNVYCPTVLKTEHGYEMWYSDVVKRPWVIRHAKSADGNTWQVTEKVALQLTQPWEGEVFVYPTVLKIDGVYLMWYGSYFNSVKREKTAIGFAASLDGVNWNKSPHNPVHTPDPKRPWEGAYVGSGSVSRLPDGSFRYWYASRKEAPFKNLYFAINTARWAGPSVALGRMPMPPKKGDKGTLDSADPRRSHWVDTLEIRDASNAIVRVWYSEKPGEEPTFADVWVKGIDTAGLEADKPAKLPQVFQVTGNQSFSTTCGSRSMLLLEVVEIK